jgi:NAD(P)-dependent dehydrogenase (short-subunit alcohol dehydrogenase family)
VRLSLIARGAQQLNTLTSEITAAGGAALAVPADLSSLTETRGLGERLAQLIASGAILIHNAGLWPTEKRLTAEGLEQAFVVNCLAPLLLQGPLIEQQRVSRIMVVSAGLLKKGRFHPQKTPYGEDFSRLRTYCTTKLCQALVMRDVSAEHHELDMVILHPGVVRTDLGASGGVPGWLLSSVKRWWESPEAYTARLARIVSKERWSPAGQAGWMVEAQEQAWPEITEHEPTRQALRETTKRILGGELRRDPT